ncbi:MAG: DUF6188 family protein [Chloroflexota bacterium]
MIEVEGATVDQCRVDYAFSILSTLHRGSLVIRIEAPFTFTFGKQVRKFDPAHPTSRGEVLGIFRERLTRVSVHDGGDLTLTFGNDSSIVVAPDTQYEAWTIAGPLGLNLVCCPGGTLSVWEPSEG